MINPQWLEQPVSRTNFQGFMDARAIEVRMYSCMKAQEILNTKNPLLQH